jgi:RNA polymerase sigma-70 factor (ECF subfamily)
MTSQEAYARSWNDLMNRERARLADDDAALVARFQRGDAAVFDTLFARHQDYAYNIVYGIVGNAEEARDLTQEVFVQVYRSLPKFRNNSRFATWLYRIAVNRAVDAARGARRWRFLPIYDEPSLAAKTMESETEPHHIAERHAERDSLQKVLMRCPLTHRQVLALRYYRDMSIEEIAETIGCSVAAAKVRLHRARQVFREHYVATFGTDSPTGYLTEEANVTPGAR